MLRIDNDYRKTFGNFFPHQYMLVTLIVKTHVHSYKLIHGKYRLKYHDYNDIKSQATLEAALKQ